MRKKAEPEPNLQLLAIEKEAVAAKAEVQALESIADNQTSLPSLFKLQWALSLLNR